MRTSLVVVLLVAGGVAQADRKLSVDDAVTIAMNQNPRLRAARSSVDASADVARSIRGRMLFGVHLSEEWQHYTSEFAIPLTAFGFMAPPGTPPIVARNQDTNSFVAAADQPLLGLARIAHDYQAQNANAAAGRAQVRGAAAELRRMVRSGFLRYFEAKALEDIAAASEHELDEQVKVSESRLKAGVLTNADVLRVKVARANAQQQRIVAHTQAITTRAALLDAIGLDDEPGLTLDEPKALLSESAAALPERQSATSDALRLRPEIEETKQRLREAQKQKTSRGLALLPDVNFDAVYLRIDGQLFQPTDQFYVGIKAQWAIWDWGATYYNYRAQGHVANARAAEVEGQRRAVATEVVTNLEQLSAAGTAVDVSQTAIASAEEAYRVMNALVQAGTATTTDLLDAQAALTTARLNLARAQYERAIAKVALDRSIGR
jgi:outer membrane protein TolC